MPEQLKCKLTIEVHASQLQHRVYGLQVPCLKERTGETLPKEKLWDAIDQSVADQPTMPILVARLKADGVVVKFSEFEDGKGLSFGIDGSKFQGRRLGKAYSLGGLQKHRGVSYEAERDDELLRELNVLSGEECRSLLREKEKPDRSPQPASTVPELQSEPSTFPEAPTPKSQPIDGSQRLVAETMLRFAQQSLKAKSLKAGKECHHIESKDGIYSIDRNPTSEIVTITRNDGAEIAQGNSSKHGWQISIAQVQPEDEQNFARYQRQREQQEKQRQRAKSHECGIGGIER